MKPAASLGRQAQQMNEGIEKGWRLSHTVRPEEIRSVAMPEPQHNRIGPAGVSSDVSLHELPKARLEDLTKICQHYEQKCRGINSSDSEAARCLFELSREIQQVVLTLTQEESDRTLAAEKEEKWFKEEWQKIFGPDASLIQDASSIEIPLPCDGVSSAGEAENSKGEEGKDDRPAELKGRSVPDGGKDRGVSPATIADAFLSLAQREAIAEKEIAEVKNERVCSEAGLREVLDACVTVPAESSEPDRLMHHEDRAAMADKHKKDVGHNTTRKALKKPLNELPLEFLNNRQHTINTEGQCRKGGEDLEQRERAEVSRMREHFLDQSSRVKNEAAAALGSSSVAEGGRRTVPGNKENELGSSSVAEGGRRTVPGNKEKERNGAEVSRMREHFQDQLSRTPAASRESNRVAAVSATAAHRAAAAAQGKRISPREAAIIAKKKAVDGKRRDAARERQQHREMLNAAKAGQAASHFQRKAAVAATKAARRRASAAKAVEFEDKMRARCEVHERRANIANMPREGERMQLPDGFRRLQHLSRRPDTVQDGVVRSTGSGELGMLRGWSLGSSEDSLLVKSIGHGIGRVRSSVDSFKARCLERARRPWVQDS